MIKSFLILISSSILLFSSQQIILVVAHGFDSNRAELEFFEDANKLFSTSVNIGRNGLAWGIGEKNLIQEKNDPIKYEGDGKAPAGIFKLTDEFGSRYASYSNLPYLHTSKNLICVDDSNSYFYNQLIINNKNEKSFEYMKRDDEQYQLGIVVQHNKYAQEKRGSCIFLHVEKEAHASTAGCTSMPLSNLKTIITLLDKDKNPLLIQIPNSSSKEILQLYPQLKSSTLLHP